MERQHNILLVEDDTTDAVLIRRALEKTGTDFNLSRLSHGDDAVAYLSGIEPFEDREAHPLPDVILLDIKLPRRSGFEVLAWIRSQRGGVSRIPVVILTSSGHRGDVNRAYDLRANGYLTKPDTARKLQEMLKEFRGYWLDWNQQPETPNTFDAQQ